MQLLRIGITDRLAGFRVLSGVAPNQRLRDSVLNHTLIDRETNMRIQDRAPSEYMQKILESHGDKNFDQLLQSHLLPRERTGYLFKDEFERFLDWREARLWEEIQKATGIS